MACCHHGRQLFGNIEASGIANPGSGSILARKNRTGVNGLALGVHKREGLIKRLRRREPLKGRARRSSGEDDEELGVIGEVNGERLALDGVDLGGKGKGERGFGVGIEDGGDGERARVESERAGVRGAESEEGGGEDGGGGEIEVEGEGDVGGQRLS